MDKYLSGYYILCSMKNRDLLPVGDKPAPGDLAFVQGSLNIFRAIKIRSDIDRLKVLKTYLVRHGLLSSAARLGKTDLKIALTFNDGMRSLLDVNSGGKPARDAIRLLNRLARRTNLTVIFDSDGSAHLEPSSRGISKALGILLVVVIRAMAEGNWQRLKACTNSECQWVFYDSSKNQSGRWCLMSACGARSKARAYRKRQKKNN